MKWSIIQLKKLQDKELEIDEEIDITENLQKRHPDIRDLSPIHVKGKIHVNEQKVTCYLQLNGYFILPCARTLEDVRYPIKVETIEVFLLQPMDEMENIEEGYHLINGDVIDLIPIIEELLLLEVPMQVFSEQAKNASTLPSGHDWKVLTEDQVNEQEQNKENVDPRLAGLADFFSKNKDKETH